MRLDNAFTRYVPSLSQLFYAFIIMAFGLTLGKWLSCLFDGSSFSMTYSSFFTTRLSFEVTSSTIMAMKRSIELLPVCFASSCVSSIFVSSLDDKEMIVNLGELIKKSWKVGAALSGALALFFIGSTLLTLIDLVIGIGRNIPFLGALFSLLYGFIYPVATLLSLVFIIISYFIALGPLHVVGFLEQERINEANSTNGSISAMMIYRSVRQLILESGTVVRSVLICGWSFGVIPLFCYQLFLMSTLHPIELQKDGMGLGFIENIALSLSTSVVETPFLLLSLFCSFYFVAKARDTKSF